MIGLQKYKVNARGGESVKMKELGYVEPKTLKRREKMSDKGSHKGIGLKFTILSPYYNQKSPKYLRDFCFQTFPTTHRNITQLLLFLTGLLFLFQQL